jgi:GT2 family glycosyltransferase
MKILQAIQYFIINLINQVQIFIISKSNRFDRLWYLKEYPDVRDSGLDPLTHFVKYGSIEGRKPYKNFPTLSYIIKYKKSHKLINVLFLDYLKDLKIKQGKNPSFQSTLFTKSLISARRRNPFKFSIFHLVWFLLFNQKLNFYSHSNPKFSIIIISWNTPGLLLKQLREFSKIKKTPFEIILIDNGSSKLTQLLLSRISGLTIKQNQLNVGYPKAVNQSLELSKAPIVILLNSDALPLGNWVDLILKNFSDSKIKILGAKIINSKNRVQEAGNLIWSDGVCQRIGENYSINNFKVNRIGITDFCSACFLAIDKSILTEDLIFDENFSPAYYEDVDFALNMKNKGFDTYYDPSITVYHLENASSNSSFAQRQININWKKFVAKNINLLHLLDARTQDIDLHDERVTTQRMKNRILVIDSLFPSEINGQGAPRLKEIVKVLSNDRNYVDVLFRQGQYESISNSFPILPTGILEISGPLNDELLKLAIESKYRIMNIFWISRLENLLWLKVSGYLDKFILQGRVIFDFEAVRNEELNPEALSILNSVDQIIVVNENDKNVLKSMSLESNIIGYEPSELLPTDIPVNSGDIVFVGNLEKIESDNFKSLIKFRSNLEHFGSSTKNLILSNLKIYGKCSPESKKVLEGCGYILKGFEPNTKSIFMNAKLFISPSLNPQGIPIKLKLASSYGVPCLVTKELGAQLNWKSNIDAFISNSELNFIEILVNLLKNDEIRYNFAVNLRESNSTLNHYISFKKSILTVLH